jgi:hypothetical protein
MSHETKNIEINNQVIPVDKEMADIIIILNKLGYLTSGCCIGEDGINKAWIIIQEINEQKIINLINILNDCCYELIKQFYKKNNDSNIYVQYILKTPEGLVDERIKWINKWNSKLKDTTNIKTVDFKYEYLYKLFE